MVVLRLKPEDRVHLDGPNGSIMLEAKKVGEQLRLAIGAPASVAILHDRADDRAQQLAPVADSYSEGG